jgi:signal transduction histidine kinase
LSHTLFYRILLIILFSLVPGAALVAVQLYDVGNLERVRANGEALSRIKLIAARYDDAASDALALLSFLGSDSALTVSPSKCRARLGEMTREHRSLVAVMRIDVAGQVQCEAGVLPGNDEVVKTAVAKAVTIGNAFIESDGSADHTFLLLSSPLTNQSGEHEGALVAGLRLPVFAVSDLGLPPDAMAVMISGTDYILLNRSTAAVELEPTLTSELLQPVRTASETGVRTMSQGSAERMIAQAAFGPPGAHMSIALVMPNSHALMISQRLKRSTFVVLTAAMIFMFFGLWIGYAVSIARWIDVLTFAARRMRGGSNDARAGPPYGPGELGELARAFDSMTEGLKQHQRLSADAHRRLVDAIEIIPEGFMLCDEQDRIVLVNSRFREIYPATARRMRDGLTFREMIEIASEVGDENVPLRSQAEALERRLSYRANPTGTLEDWSQEGRCIVVSDHRTPSGWTVTIFSDVTAQRLAAQELSARVAELEAIRGSLADAKQEAETALKAKSQFLANMSHELRTPLNAIIGFSEVLTSQMFGPVGNERYYAYIQDILQSAHHLLKIINDILDMSKIEAGKMVLNDDRVDLITVIENCVRLLAARARDQQIELIVQPQANLPPVCADALRIKQALLNVMANAVKFSCPGGTVTIKGAVNPRGDLELVVADTGIGMTDEGVRIALEPFRQIDNTLNRRFEGTGLGLPLTNELMKLHDGHVEIESHIGAGTIVRLVLPARRVLSKDAA